MSLMLSLSSSSFSGASSLPEITFKAVKRSQWGQHTHAHTHSFYRCKGTPLNSCGPLIGNLCKSKILINLKNGDEVMNPSVRDLRNVTDLTAISEKNNWDKCYFIKRK